MDECKHVVSLDLIYIRGIIDKVIANIDDDDLIKIKNNSEKLKKIKKEIGFNEYNYFTNDKIKIEIYGRNLKDGKIKIKRIILKGYSVETGWIKIKNLPNYINKNLFENKQYIKRFDKFIYN